MGIIGRDADIIPSSPLIGAPGTEYPITGDFHQFDFIENQNPEDAFTLLSDGRTLVVTAQAGVGHDQFRVLTAPSAPEPATLGLIATGATVLLTR